MNNRRWVWVAVTALLLVQVVLVVSVVRRESLTFDEGNHMFSGYMMMHTGDYGLNPEHPPLAKLLAVLPLAGAKLWVPPLQGRDFKMEAYLDGRDWLARNDGASGRMVLKMRLAAGLLALGLSLMVFFATREWFGTTAALVALVLVVFDPNILAHSALVTTDIGVSLFFLAAVYAFYRYVKQPTVARLLIAGVVAGLMLATKHSGVLLAPMLVLLIGFEILRAPQGTRGKIALRLTGAFAAIVVIGAAVLWAFYGFRYAARPAGLAMSSSIEEYVRPLSHFNAGAVLAIAHLHLLPESYLIGLVDVKRMAQFYPTFVLGRQYAHSVWWYFPVVVLIKTTLGLLGLLAVTCFAIVSSKLRKGRELAFVLIPMAVYFSIAVAAGMDIGARHLLPVYVFAFVLAGGGIAALAAQSKGWKWAGLVLVAAHVVSALAVMPAPLAYANEAWGGAKNTLHLLSDANVDWGQQLYQVKAWQDRNPGVECWFAYFAYPEIDPATYGITCHHLPNIDTFWLGGVEVAPPRVHGAVLISAGDLSGCEWPSGKVSPYGAFQKMEPDEVIDNAVFVYRGDLDLRQAAAMSRAMFAYTLLQKGKMDDALAMAREGAAIDPHELMSQSALGDIAAAKGNKDEAHAAWQAALGIAQELEPDAQPSYVPELEKKLKAS
ncbi:MAG: glycosyltransferase family 39 protein [Terracidiphilus sp.]